MVVVVVASVAIAKIDGARGAFPFSICRLLSHMQCRSNYVAASVVIMINCRWWALGLLIATCYALSWFEAFYCSDVVADNSSKRLITNGVVFYIVCSARLQKGYALQCFRNFWLRNRCKTICFRMLSLQLCCVCNTLNLLIAKMQYNTMCLELLHVKGGCALQRVRSSWLLNCCKLPFFEYVDCKSSMR